MTWLAKDFYYDQHIGGQEHERNREIEMVCETRVPLSCHMQI